jgi:hypothetical protein
MKSARLAALTFFVVGCAATWQENVSTSLGAALQATNAARDLAVLVSEQAQKRVVDDLEAAAKALPEDAERARKVEELKATARGQVAEIRKKRDRVLEAAERSYKLLGMAAVLVPLAGDLPEKKVEVLRLIGEAYKALEAM